MDKPKNLTGGDFEKVMDKAKSLGFLSVPSNIFFRKNPSNGLILRYSAESGLSVIGCGTTGDLNVDYNNIRPLTEAEIVECKNNGLNIGNRMETITKPKSELFLQPQSQQQSQPQKDDVKTDYKIPPFIKEQQSQFDEDFTSKIRGYDYTDDKYQYVDIMCGLQHISGRVLDKGVVSLVDVMPRLVPQKRELVGLEFPTGDKAVIDAARVSYGKGTSSYRSNKGLINYLMSNNHTTPFEMVELKFKCVVPKFIAIQWFRHRTASINEYSARYSEIKDVFYNPDIEILSVQDKVNRQGSGKEKVERSVAEKFLDYVKNADTSFYEGYLESLKDGLSKEHARIVMPVNTYTEFYWKIDLHNLMHFLRLRMDSHAQIEIQLYAKEIFKIVKTMFPLCMEAFENYRLKSVTFSGYQMDILRGIMTFEEAQKKLSKRELDSFMSLVDSINTDVIISIKKMLMSGVELPVQTQTQTQTNSGSERIKNIDSVAKYIIQNDIEWMKYVPDPEFGSLYNVLKNSLPLQQSSNSSNNQTNKQDTDTNNS